MKKKAWMARLSNYAASTSWCLRKVMLEIQLWGHAESKFPVSASEGIHIQCFTFVRCRGGCAVCRQAPLCPEALRRWRCTPPTWTRKRDFASPWETASHPMAPSLTSPAEMVLHHGKKETMKVISLLSVVGRKVPTPGQGCQVNAATVAGQEREGGDGSWLQNCSEGLHLLEGPCDSSGHGTWNTALLRLLAGSREVSLYLFGGRW